MSSNDLNHSRKRDGFDNNMKNSKEKKLSTKIQKAKLQPRDVEAFQASLLALEDPSNESPTRNEHETDENSALIQSLLTDSLDIPPNQGLFYRIDNDATDIHQISPEQTPYPEMLRPYLNGIGFREGNSQTRPFRHENTPDTENLAREDDLLDSSFTSTPVLTDHFDRMQELQEQPTHVASLSTNYENRDQVVITSGLNQGDREAIVLDVSRSDFWILVDEDEAEAEDDDIETDKKATKDKEKDKSSKKTNNNTSQDEFDEPDFVVIDQKKFKEELSQYIMDILMLDPSARMVDPQQLRSTLTGPQEQAQASFFGRMFGTSTTTTGDTSKQKKSPRGAQQKIESTYYWINSMFDLWKWASFGFAIYRNPRLSRTVLTWVYKAVKYAIVFIA